MMFNINPLLIAPLKGFGDVVAIGFINPCPPIEYADGTVITLLVMAGMRLVSGL